MLGGQSKTQSAVVMEFVLYTSPAMIHGLLMTETITEYARDYILGNFEPKIERFFFGYSCSQCKEIFLIPSQVRTERDVYDSLRHSCDPSDLRRAVRNAREIGRERGEVIMEGMNGRWWVENHP